MQLTAAFQGAGGRLSEYAESITVEPNSGASGWASDSRAVRLSQDISQVSMKHESGCLVRLKRKNAVSLVELKQTVGTSVTFVRVIPIARASSVSC